MENIEATADFILKDLGGHVRTLQLLSFMRLGEEKYRQLGRPVPSPAFGIPSQDQLDHWRAMAQAMGRRVVSYR